MPTIKVFVTQRTTSDRGTPLPKPVTEAAILYDDEAFPYLGVGEFEFSMDLANPFAKPIWNLRSGAPDGTINDIAKSKR